MGDEVKLDPCPVCECTDTAMLTMSGKWGAYCRACKMAGPLVASQQLAAAAWDGLGFYVAKGKQQCVGMKTAARVLKLARLRGELLYSVYTSATAFGYGVVRQKIERDDCMKTILENDRDIEQLEVEMAEAREAAEGVS